MPIQRQGANRSGVAGLGIAIGVLAGLAVQPRVARACVEPTMRHDEALTKLRTAERALDARDFSVVRELSLEVRLGACNSGYTSEPESRDVARRAVRLEALALVRDPTASDADHGHAVDLLMARFAEPPSREPGPPTAFYVALGEALERVSRDEEALVHLRNPLGDDAYAYAAYARASRRQGDGASASLADARCRAVATDPYVCRGWWPAPSVRSPAAPEIWNRVCGWAPAGIVFLLVLLLHRRRQLAIFLEQRLFVRAARRGRIADCVVRPTERGDERAPVLYLVFGPTKPQTIERQRTSSYREASREPVLRLMRRPTRWS